MYNSSGTIRLNIETYLAGKNQPTHPSLVSFDHAWNGYKYWMAYSPYPYANGEEENPCIAVSNDLLYWDIPEKFVNPIATNEEVGCNELKDPHIFYREDMDQIEVWYLGRLHPNLGGDGESLLIFRKTSSDGIHWSNYEILSETRYLSPSIIWDNGCYKLWEIGFEGQRTEGTLTYRESQDGYEWSESKLCSIGGCSSQLKLWHGAVSKIQNIYYFVYIELAQKCKQILFCISENGTDFDNTEELILLDDRWESFYRPYLLWNGVQYICIYGVINGDNSWYLSMNSGETLDKMRGITSKDCIFMKSLTNDCVIDCHRFQYKCKKAFRDMKSSIRLELYAFTPLIFFFCILASQAFAAFFSVTISIGYLMYRGWHNSKMRMLVIFIGICEGISIFSIAQMFYFFIS